MKIYSTLHIGRRAQRTDLCHVLRCGTAAFTLCALAAVTALPLFIIIKGLPHIDAQMFSLRYSPDNLSIMPALINTAILTALSLVFSLPPGIAAAVYLCEYAERSNPFVGLIRLSADILSGVPSVVFGMFGMLVFVSRSGGYSLLAGSITLAVMTLPTVIRTTEDALLSLPAELADGGRALGDTKFGVTLHLLLPAALPGIANGAVLAAGRIAAETAALIYTAGTAAGIASPIDSGRTAAVHIYVLFCEGMNSSKAYAAAAVLTIIIILINAVFDLVKRRMREKSRYW